MLFWTLAAFMVLAALVMLMPSLFGRRRGTVVDRETLNTQIFNDRLAELDRGLAAGELTRTEYDRGRHELERELLRDVGAPGAASPPADKGRGSAVSAIAVGLFVPLLTVGLYFGIGEHELVAREGLAPRHPQVAEAGGGGERVPPVDELVERLAQRLADNPRDVEGWTMLGRSYQMLQSYDKALAAFARARELEPQNPDLMVFYAENLALSRDGNLMGEPERFVSRALAIDPSHQNGLWLKGLAARQRGDAATALESWRRLRGQLGPEEQATLDGFIAELEGGGQAAPRAADRTPAPASSAEPAPAPADEGEGAIRVKVSLAADQAGEASPSDTVFVFARAASGPRMPLAIVRKTVADLPLEVVLSDEMAMAPSFRLSNFDQVVVGARVSRSGNAMPQAGDLEGTSAPIAWREAPPVEVVIDTRI